MRTFTRRMNFSVSDDQTWLATVRYNCPPVKRPRRRVAGVRIIGDGTVFWQQYSHPARTEEHGGEGAAYVNAGKKIIVEAFGGANLDRVWVVGLGTREEVDPA